MESAIKKFHQHLVSPGAWPGSPTLKIIGIRNPVFSNDPPIIGSQVKLVSYDLEYEKTIGAIVIDSLGVLIEQEFRFPVTATHWAVINSAAGDEMFYCVEQLFTYRIGEVRLFYKSGYGVNEPGTAVVMNRFYTSREGQDAILKHIFRQEELTGSLRFVGQDESRTDIAYEATPAMKTLTDFYPNYGIRLNDFVFSGTRPPVVDDFGYGYTPLRDYKVKPIFGISIYVGTTRLGIFNRSMFTASGQKVYIGLGAAQNAWVLRSYDGPWISNPDTMNYLISPRTGLKVKFL